MISFWNRLIRGDWMDGMEMNDVYGDYIYELILVVGVIEVH